MNTRQKKKFKKKLNCKTYLRFRRKRIIRRCSSQSTDPYQRDIVYIQDSKRMDLKHPLHVYLLKNTYPVSMGVSNINDKEATNNTCSINWRM